MRLYDLCLAWNWEHDADFVRILDSACAARGRTLLDVSARNLRELLPLLSERSAGFRLFLDRASEADSSYLSLVDAAKLLGARRLNPRELADRAYDKAAMHAAFLAGGIPVPQTAILPPLSAQPDLPPIDLSPFNGRFAVKPALGGGGEGVVVEISTPEQIQSARREFPDQQYLLQEHVTPKIVDGLPAWFRVIYCLGEVFVNFWDTTTHVYTPVRVGAVGAVLGDCPAEGGAMGGHVGPPQPDPPQPNPSQRPFSENLRGIARQIASICRLDLFSTEIAWTEDDRLLVVDYVNDPIDLRLQSRAADGVPDFIVERIAARIVDELTAKADGV
ncbi:MAG: hypothetical protein M5U11_06230 [Anaerolineales bacterium]|nr:hypothetical protein [Anaerolineales bacterium]MDX9936364.1 hypothetical protein [Anaerolineales bacterium]GER80967.1 conserved hypothetical protein [Candidatus Denitrolinea symbiosum]